MTEGGLQREEENALRQRCLAGHDASLRQLREMFHGLLVGVLQQRGANPTEAADIVADLWSECVGDHGRPSLLARFGGRCALRTWLIAVATNRLVDVKRRERLRHQDKGREALTGHPASNLPTPPREEALTRLLHVCLQEALCHCDQDGLLMLKLVHLHGLTQREVGQMWGWHESKISRHMGNAMEAISAGTRAGIRRRDPWLEIGWEDLLEVCQAGPEGFF